MKTHSKDRLGYSRTVREEGDRPPCKLTDLVLSLRLSGP